jgi:hypothetical protein
LGLAKRVSSNHTVILDDAEHNSLMNQLKADGIIKVFKNSAPPILLSRGETYSHDQLLAPIL